MLVGTNVLIDASPQTCTLLVRFSLNRVLKERRDHDGCSRMAVKWGASAMGRKLGLQ